MADQNMTTEERLGYLEHLSAELDKKVNELRLARVAFERMCGPGGFQDVMMRLRRVSPAGAYIPNKE